MKNVIWCAGLVVAAVATLMAWPQAANADVRHAGGKSSVLVVNVVDVDGQVLDASLDVISGGGSFTLKPTPLVPGVWLVTGVRGKTTVRVLADGETGLKELIVPRSGLVEVTVRLGDVPPPTPAGEVDLSATSVGALNGVRPNPLPGCPLDCPPGGLDEGEACGDDDNGGCNTTFQEFVDAACGETWCGTTWADAAMRDTDWYLVTHGGGILSATLVSQEPNVCFIVDIGFPGCGPVVVGSLGCADACANIDVASADLPAGTYVVFVAPGVCGGGGLFEGNPCGTNNDYTVTIECDAPGDNDLCEDAIAVAVPSTTAGSTIDATFDDVGDCGTANTAPGVWYSVTGTGNMLTASTCNQANYDTKISVFCRDCDEQLCVGGLDDTGGCGGFTTEFSWCSQAGAEYLILVHGFSDATGDFDLTLSDDGVACVGAVECLLAGACCYDDGSCAVIGEADCDAGGGTYQGDETACAVDGIVIVSEPDAAIPDSDPAGISDTISIPIASGIQIDDLDVDLVIDHTWVGDLCITLEHGGTTVVLAARPGADDGVDDCHADSPFGCADDNYDVVLDDEGLGGALEDLCSNAMVSPPNYTPFEALSAFDGDDLGGDWTLTVSDNAGGDTGTLVRWSLHINNELICVDCDENDVADHIQTAPENLPEDAVAQDDCEDAMLVGPGIVYYDDTYDATHDGYEFCGLYFGVYDVWYRVRTKSNGVAFVELSGPPEMWICSIFTSCPGTEANMVTCNATNPSGVVWWAERGQDYYVRIAAQGWQEADFRFRFVGADPWLNLDDFNGNGIPDDCECLYDVDGDNDVDVDDYVAVLIAFGSCPDLPAPCPADVDMDGDVDEHDAQIVWLAIGTVCAPI